MSEFTDKVDALETCLRQMQEQLMKAMAHEGMLQQRIKELEAELKAEKDRAEMWKEAATGKVLVGSSLFDAAG